jgi:hypothetical protein
MRTISNERRIRTSRAVAQYGTLAGLLALLGGLVISFVKPDWLWMMVLSVTLGYALSVVGGFFTDRFAGPLAHHEAISNALKGLDNRHVLLQYTLPAPHVLIEPGGCTAFIVKTQGGHVRYQEGGRWKHQQKGKFFRQFVGQEAIGAPDMEANRQAHKLEQWFERRLPDVPVLVRAVVVFVNPDVTLEIEGAAVPVLHSKKLKTWLRGPGKLKPLPSNAYRQVVETVAGES